MEKTGCKIICGAPATLAVKGLMMMMMMVCVTSMCCGVYVGKRGDGEGARGCV